MPNLDISMKYYTKPDGTVLCFKLDGSQDEFIMQDYCVSSLQELESAYPSKTQAEMNAELQAQIKSIENETNMNRFVREMSLKLSEKEAAALNYTPAQLYLANPGYKAIKDVDDRISALRSQIV
jgi:hypothetical protein